MSPDGRLIAYTGFDWTDDTWRDATLYVMNADGSSPRALTTSLDRTPMQIEWASDGTGIYFTIEDKGSRNLWFAPLRGEPRALTTGTQMLTVTDIRGTTAVGLHSAFNDPTDVVSFALKTPGTVRQLTNVNEDVLAGKTLGAVEEIWVKSVDDFRIQGWVVKPPDFDAKRKYPMMLVIHGGPHAMYNVGFNFSWQEHAANGYVVLYTNPRGSTGYGSAFGNAIKFAYPSKDYDDLMAAVDTVVARGYVDTEEAVRVRMQRWRRADVVDRRPHGSLCGRVGELPRHELAELRRDDGHQPVGLQPVPEAPLGGSVALPQALTADVRREREDADDADDGRARSAHADLADGGVLPGAEVPEGSDGNGALQRGVSRDVVEAVELPADAAVFAVVVRAVHAEGECS